METAAELIPDDQLAEFCSRVARERSLDCTQFRPSYLRRRLGTRLRATGCADLGSYLSRLDGSYGEWDALFTALTVNVTGFFRDAGAWSYLENHILPLIVAEKRRRSQSYVRAWSAGCSTGQEPYSLAMLFKEMLGSDDATSRARITATDVDKACLVTAKRAVYGMSDLAGVTSGRRAQHFEHAEEGLRVISQVRHMVRFLHQDLFQESGQRLMDLVLCRNVVMYFSREQQRQIFAKFADALVPSGFLVLGKSEKLPTYMAPHFEHYCIAERVYRKRSPEAIR